MTDAELAVLSIVGAPFTTRHPTIIDRRGLRAWITSACRHVHVLEKQALRMIESDEDTAGQNTRWEFTSGAGFGVLQTAVADLLTTPHEFADGFGLTGQSP